MINKPQDKNLDHCTKRSHSVEKTLMPLRELSHTPLPCVRVNSRTLAGGQS